MPAETYYGEGYFGGATVSGAGLSLAATPPNPFTYPAWDLLSMEPLDPLPYNGVTFGQALNEPGPWQGSLLISDPRVRELRYLDSNRPGRTALFVDFAGKLVWGGIIWTRRYQMTTKLLKVGAQEFGSYFQQRLQAADYTSTWTSGEGEDPMKIVRQLIEEGQNNKPGGKIAGGITVTLNPEGGSGQKVPVSYPGTQLQTIDSIISTLSQMGFDYGFDYSYDCEYLPGTKTPGITLNFWYPRKGRTAAESGIVITAKDAVDYEYLEDATKQANEITETGSGSNGILPVTAEADEVIEAIGYPRLGLAISHTQVTSDEVLARITLGDLALRCWPVVTPTLTMPVPLPNAAGEIDPTQFSFGDFENGDDARFEIDPIAGGGENTDPRFPDGLSFEFRITTWTCTVADKGLSTILFDLSIPPISGLPVPQPPL